MYPMTSLERVAAVLDGRVPDRVPVGLHNFLMAGRAIGADLAAVLRDGERSRTRSSPPGASSATT